MAFFSSFFFFFRGWKQSFSFAGKPYYVTVYPAAPLFSHHFPQLPFPLPTLPCYTEIVHIPQAVKFVPLVFAHVVDTSFYKWGHAGVCVCVHTCAASATKAGFNLEVTCWLSTHCHRHRWCTDVIRREQQLFHSSQTARLSAEDTARGTEQGLFGTAGGERRKHRDGSVTVS